MKRNVPLSLICAATTAMLIAACGLVIDPDVLIAGANLDGGGNNNIGDGSTGDGPIIDPNCKPAGPEICDDGIDNDCNGSVDCADSTCGATFECVDAPPEGWTSVALAVSSRPPCPAGHGGSTDVEVMDGNGAHTCQCDCGGSCTGNITVAKGTDTNCTAGTETFAANTGATCTNVAGAMFDLTAFGRITGPTTPTCAPTNVATKANLTNGRTCAPPQQAPKANSGCAGSQRCVPKSSGFLSCIAKPGNNACPAPSVFTKQRRVGSTDTNDGRICTGCSCNNGGACSVELELWSQPQCSGGADATLTSAAHGACAATSAVSNVKAYKSKTTGGCSQATPSLPQGTVAFQGEQTICCK